MDPISAAQAGIGKNHMPTATRILMVMSVMIVCVLSLWISLARARPHD
jgi:hypothetical protein